MSSSALPPSYSAAVHPTAPDPDNYQQQTGYSYNQQPAQQYPNTQYPPYPNTQNPSYPNTQHPSYPLVGQQPQYGASAYPGANEGPGDGSTVNIVQPGAASDWAGASFSEKKIRLAFIRKVYLILMAQLAFTVGIICLFLFCRPVKEWVQANQWFYWVSYGVFLVTYITLVCIPNVRRQVPANYICLTIFTVAFTYMTATIASYYDTVIVLVAIGVTAAVCLAISLFAIQTKIDFTMCSGLIFALFMVVFFFGLACLITYLATGHGNYILSCVYGGLAALLFSLFLVYDTQGIIGGRKYSLSPEEYVYGSLQLYLDVVYLFLILLSLVGGGKSN